MSTTPSPPRPPAGPREVRIYSHSALFYWWPVWAVGFLMAMLTYWDGHVVAFVPEGTVGVLRNKDVRGNDDPRDILILPKDAKLPLDTKTNEPVRPSIHMAQSKNLGVVWGVVLIVIIVITNVPLRGLWSLVIILMVVLLSVLFALFEVWDTIISYFSLLRIHINAAGYVMVSLVLAIIWGVTFYIFDRRTYVAISSGQVRVCLAVGAGETVYDTTGMTFSKRQDDLFRHWIVGLGSGDLIIMKSATHQEIDMPNVLFVGSKIKEIEKLVKEREVV